MVRLVEEAWIGEGLVGEMAGFEIAPDDFDVVEFGSVFGQPLDDEPVGAFGERRQRRLAEMDRVVVEHENDRLKGRAGLRAVETVKEPQMVDEVGAALGARGGDDELAPGVVERAAVVKT